MEYLVTKKEMQAYDTYTIEQIGIPALVLMERAALCTASRVLAALKGRGKVLCVCGVGNNGGDGLAVARMLADEDVAVEVALIGDRAHASKETDIQLTILEKYKIRLLSKVAAEEYDIVVDALFGTGLSRELTGVYKEAVSAVNALKAYKISIDMPSGIDADNGAVLGEAVWADETVTIAFKKRGLYLYPGAEYAGKIFVANIGITEKGFAAGMPKMYTLTEEPCMLLPKRKPDGNKGTFGKLLLVAGSSFMAGAALLSASGAYKTGAGMVKLVIPEKIRVIVQGNLPEALIQVYEDEAVLTEAEQEAFLENAMWADVIAAGPGMAQNPAGKRLLTLAVSQTKKPLILDADALNMLAEDISLQQMLAERGKDLHIPCILTPHLGELARLLRKDTKTVVENQIACCREAAERFGCVVVAKSARTCVSDGRNMDFLNTAGNAKMATAGSGDVLTGMIAALMCQGKQQKLTAKDAAVLGVYMHACAGDKAANNGMLSGDIIHSIHLIKGDIDS